MENDKSLKAELISIAQNLSKSASILNQMPDNKILSPFINNEESRSYVNEAYMALDQVIKDIRFYVSSYEE